jgi:hypothetical protein
MLHVVLTLCLFFFTAVPFSLSAQSTPPGSAPPVHGSVAKVFPAIYAADTLSMLRNQEATKPYWVPTESELNTKNTEDVSLFLNYDIVAYYGHPNSKVMGILGRLSKEEVERQLTEYAAQFKAVNGGKGVRTAFYIIFGTVWPEGEIGIIGETRLMEYIDYALEHDMLVFLDHQIGKYTPLQALRRLLPWLRYPNVHLALDPEWRTTKPMQEIGFVYGEEINQVQQVMEDYIIENNIPGERILVIHQFKPVMIEGRGSVKTNFERVRLVHCADGWGTASQKLGSYGQNALATNMPIKGFKVFLPSTTTNNVDKPVFTPQQVMNLNPRPYLIMYQ